MPISNWKLATSVLATLKISVLKVEHPYGESHYSAATDERGKVTVRSIGRHQSQEKEVVSILTNGIETVRTITTTLRNGPTTVRREWLVGRDASHRAGRVAVLGDRLDGRASLHRLRR